METLSKVLRGALATAAVFCLVAIGATAQDQSSGASSTSGTQASSASGNAGQSSADQSTPSKISDQDSSSKSSKKASSSKSDQASAGAAGSSSGQLSAMDKQFVTKAAQGGMAEVELGQLAQQNAESQEVKDFGKRMVDDHTKANDQLKQIAEQKGVTVPSDLPAKEKATKDRLSKLKGEQFDRAYMQHMVMDHQKDVAEFKKASTSAKDSDVKSFASQTLPTLQDHLKQAQQVSKTEQSEGHKTGSKKAKAETTTASTPKQ